MQEKFLEYLAHEKRYSVHTVISYRKDLLDFQEYLSNQENVPDIIQADKKKVRNFIAYLSAKNFSKRSINRKISSLRSFYLFLMKIGEIAASPVENIASLKFFQDKQSPMSEEEMQQLAEHYSLEGDALLEHCIIEILYQTGIRKAELCGLKFEDVSIQSQQIKVQGKGNKQRIIPISENLCQMLEQYSAARNPKEGFEEYFLLSKKGKKLSEKFVYTTVNKYLSVVTSKEKKSPHMLRHSFATHVLNNGAEISKVKKILGHSSLASTQVYTSANIEQLKKVYNLAHPRAAKKEEL